MKSLITYFCFWVAVLGLFFVGLGLRLNDNEMILFSLPFLFFSGAMAAIAYTFKIIFKG